VTTEQHPEPLSDPVEFRVLNRIGIISQLAQNILTRHLPHEMTLAQFTVLNHFARLGGHRSPVELARSFQVSKGAITNTIGRLSDKGFVTVTPDPRDGRAKRVALTSAGLAARNEAVTALGEPLRALGKGIASHEFEAALPFLEKLGRWLDAHREI
jgi:DNA-binding MarR family transcriptional regulator